MAEVEWEALLVTEHISLRSDVVVDLSIINGEYPSGSWVPLSEVRGGSYG